MSRHAAAVQRDGRPAYVRAAGLAADRVTARWAAARELAALVVDGAVRDIEGWAAGPLPVFARGVEHLGPHEVGPGASATGRLCRRVEAPPA